MVPMQPDLEPFVPFPKVLLHDHLDGGVLAPRMGLLVIQSQRRGASPVEVQIDQRAVGNAPVNASLTEGLHTLRFRAGIITSYQFATIRPGYALVLEAPSDR